MGAVFALFSAWYYWIPKLIGLDYNIMLGKVHFWIFFIGVCVNGRNFEFKQDICSFRAKLPKPRKGFGRWRSYSTITNGKAPNGESPNEFIMYFEDVKKLKTKIYQDLRGKSGVYLFINSITKDTYLGSSLNLTERMTSHFYFASSDNYKKTILVRAMKKYGLENFSLGIIEFCGKDVILCTNLEQKWMDHYKPSYNTLKVAGSSFGFTHKIETIVKLKELFRKENHPNFGKKFTCETKKPISDNIRKFYLNNNHPSKGLKGKLSPQYGIGGSFVFCYNENNDELILPSINATRQHFKVRWTYIKKNIDNGEYLPLNGEKWIIQSIPRDKTQS